MILIYRKEICLNNITLALQIFFFLLPFMVFDELLKYHLNFFGLFIFLLFCLGFFSCLLFIHSVSFSHILSKYLLIKLHMFFLDGKRLNFHQLMVWLIIIYNHTLATHILQTCLFSSFKK